MTSSAPPASTGLLILGLALPRLARLLVVLPTATTPAPGWLLVLVSLGLPSGPAIALLLVTGLPPPAISVRLLVILNLGRLAERDVAPAILLTALAPLRVADRHVAGVLHIDVGLAALLAAGVVAVDHLVAVNDDLGPLGLRAGGRVAGRALVDDVRRRCVQKASLLEMGLPWAEMTGYTFPRRELVADVASGTRGRSRPQTPGSEPRGSSIRRTGKILRGPSGEARIAPIRPSRRRPEARAGGGVAREPGEYEEVSS